MLNKRGQGLSTNAIVLIVLGVLVLVILIVGFTLGWDKIAPWIKPEQNVDQIRQSCQLSCNTGAQYEYCFVGKDLFTKDATVEGASCYALANSPIYSQYNIEKCPTIPCGINTNVSSAITSCKGKTENTEAYYLENGKVLKYTCTATDIQ